jgi:hypothetical protein
VSESSSLRRRLSAGRWYAVLGDRVTLLLPDDERARVTSLWDLVDTGADFDEVLDGLLSGGIRTLRAFVLVGHGPSTRVLVRGDVSVSLSSVDGDTVVSGAGETMWADRSLTGVTAGTVVLEGPAETDLALHRGIARVGSVVFGDTAMVDGAAAVAPAARPEAHAGADTGPDTVEDASAQPEALPDASASSTALPDPADDRPVADVVPIEAAASGHDSLTFGAPSDDPHPTGEQPAVDDAGLAGDAAPAGGGRPDHDLADDHDGQTTVGPPADAFVRPGIPGQEVGPAVVSRPVARLVFSTGEVVEVDRTVIVGRAPESRRLASHDQPHLVTVASPHHEISSTHLEVRPGAGADHGSAVVTDLGSTNGTVLVQPGLPPEDLQAGIAVSLIPGAILDLGDGVTIQTTNP